MLFFINLDNCLRVWAFVPKIKFIKSFELFSSAHSLLISIPSIEKPSEIKQRKKAEAKKRWQKKLKKLEKLGIVN